MRTVLVIAGLATACFQADPVKTELAKFQGEWKFVSVEADGQDITSALQDAKVAIKGSDFTLIVASGDKIIRGLKLDATTTPRCIDFLGRDDKGKPAKAGYLVLKKPWPGMLRGIYRDPQRFQAQYWSKYPGIYFTGDGAKIDEDGYFWLLGRVDDVMNISGHRVSTMEVESALVDHPHVAEAAVIGRPHEIKGQAIAAFVTIKDGTPQSRDLMEEIKGHVAKKIGALARPDDLIFASDLPKTRSGKIMRRLLRDIAEGKALGDTTTLADPNVVATLKEKYGEEE